jgi:ankyrin repeat protein
VIRELAVGFPPTAKLRGRSLLHHAIERSMVKLCEYLIDAVSDLSERDEEDRTPLLLAAELGNQEIVRSLVEAR